MGNRGKTTKDGVKETAVALPVNIDDLVNHWKVEWARIEYKEGWNPEKVLHTLCAFANDTNQYRTSRRKRYKA